MCIKLARAKSAEQGIKDAFERICVDLETLEIVGKFEFHKVSPYYRLWIWEKDLDAAKKDLELD
jgi:hypothetical protein